MMKLPLNKIKNQVHKNALEVNRYDFVAPKIYQNKRGARKGRHLILGLPCNEISLYIFVHKRKTA